MDFADILIVIFAIIGAIVSAVAKKNAKKKTEVDQQSQPPYFSWMEEDESAAEEYMKAIPKQSRELSMEAISQQSRELHTLESAPRRLWSYDQQAIAEAESPNSVNDTHRPKRSQRNSDDNAYSVNEEGRKHDIIEDINLRHAIIYSELLKPKFKEY